MNKLLLVSITGVLACFICSCAKTSDDNSSNDFVSYKVIDMNYTDNEGIDQYININYPVIIDMKDSIVEETINEHIKSLAFDVLNQFTSLSQMEIDVSYEITYSSSNMLSLYFIVRSFHIAQAYPLIRISTATFLTGSGDIIKLRDIVDINDDFVDMFFDNFRLIADYYSIESQNYVKEYTLQYFESNKLLSCDDDIASEFHNYFKDTSLIISVAVPHALGSYALFEATIDDLESYMKTR